MSPISSKEILQPNCGLISDLLTKGYILASRLDSLELSFNSSGAGMSNLIQNGVGAVFV